MGSPGKERAQLFHGYKLFTDLFWILFVSYWLRILTVCRRRKQLTWMNYSVHSHRQDCLTPMILWVVIIY